MSSTRPARCVETAATMISGRILVVDDSPTYRLAVASELQRAGATVVVARSGDEALGMLETEVVDGVLLDYVMPGLTGPETCQKIRDNPSWHGIAVLMLTSEEDEQSVLEGLRAGADDYVLKSGNFDVLKTRLRVHLQRRQHEEQLLRKNAELQQAMDSLETARGVAEAAERARGAFVASIAHEIRTPLNAVLGYAQLLRHEAGLAPKQRSHVLAIERGGEHLMGLINGVLERSRLEAGEVDLQESTFDPRRTLDQVVDMLRTHSDAKGLTLASTGTSAVPRHVVADEGKLRQILINLVGNAIKFTVAGGVQLSADREDEGVSRGCVLRIAVVDTGRGLAPDDLDRIFDKFAQTEPGKRQGGAGLGLTISRQYARLMGGELTATNTTGGGSEFCLRIPVQRVTTAEVSCVLPVRPIVELSADWKGTRVLVVDDIEENRTVLVALLEAVGFVARGAADGVSALRSFEQWQPELVLMDLRMPGMDGFETMRRLRRLRGGDRVPLIAISASAFEADRDAARAAGADDFMSKPYRDQELLGAVGRHLGAQYVHADDSDPASPQHAPAAEVLAPGALSGLPSELLARLRAATSAADVEALEKLIELIEDESVRGGLDRLIRGYEYGRVLTLIEAVAGA